MSTAKFASVRRAALGILIVSVATGCSVIIVEPKDQSVTVPASVASEITLPGMYKANTFRARLNERDVTSQYTVANGKATGTLTGLVAAPYVLDVDACWGLNILFVQQPQWPVSGCSSARASFSIVQPRLTLNLMPTSVTAVGSLQASVQVTPVPATAVNVTVSSSNTAVASIQPPLTRTVAPNTASAGWTVSSVGAGTATIAASAPGYTGDTASVTVKPRLTQLTPSSAAAGTSLTATGAGFVAPLTVRFGNTTAPTPTNISASQFNVTVPTGLAAGATQVTVTSNGQTSAPLAFTVSPPAATARALFRSMADRIEIIVFSQATPFATSTFAIPTLLTVSTSTGMQTVALCRNASTLARASSNALELFTIGGSAAAPTLTAGAKTPLPSGLTGVGSDCVFAPGALVRGTDLGLETLDPSTDPLARLGGNNTGGSSSVGVSLAANGTTVFRSHTTGLETYSVATPGSPTKQSNVTSNMSGAPTGSALAWLVPGSTLIRATSAGIDLLNVTTPTSPSRLGFNNTGHPSANGVDVAIAGARVVRATDEGIEVYDVSNTAQPQRCFFRNADPSATGVGLAVVGTVAFRATDETIEAYDLSGVLTAACPATASNTAIPAPIQQNVRPATTGVALIAF